jgi:hypothetical protein
LKLQLGSEGTDLLLILIQQGLNHALELSSDQDPLVSIFLLEYVRMRTSTYLLRLSLETRQHILHCSLDQDSTDETEAFPSWFGKVGFGESFDDEAGCRACEGLGLAKGRERERERPYACSSASRSSSPIFCSGARGS